MKPNLTHASLFSGIGGAEVAARQMGWTNLFHCEINPFGRRVLEYWFPKLKSYDDITKTDFREWRGRVSVLTGGFPCQPFSLAGARKGAEDDRYLWPQMLRAIREIQPDWVVGENVAGITTMVEPGPLVGVEGYGDLFETYHYLQEDGQFTIERICRDFEQEGYTVQPFVIPACACGAPHRRDRVWFVARRNVENANCDRRNNPIGQAGPDEWQQRMSCAGNAERLDREARDNSSDTNNPRLESPSEGRLPKTDRPFNAPDTDSSRGYELGNDLQSEVADGPVADGDGLQRNDSGREYPQERWRAFPTQPPVRCGYDGLPPIAHSLTIPLNKLCQESIKAYGNAWVPQVAYEIFRAIENEYDQ